jgi:hypothetical protein
VLIVLNVNIYCLELKNNFKKFMLSLNIKEMCMHKIII